MKKSRNLFISIFVMKKMLKTFLNLKLLDNNKNIIYFDSLLPDIKSYYFVISDKTIKDKIVEDVETLKK